MLEVTNLTKTFGPFKALDSLSMRVPKGAVYGLVAPTARENPPPSGASPASTARTAAASPWTASRCMKILW